MRVVASNQNNSATGSTGTSECSPIHCWIKNRTEPKYRFYGKHDLEEHKAWNPVLKNSTTCTEQLQDMRDWKPWLAVFINHARRSLSLSKCHSCHRSWHTTGPTIPDRLFAQLSTRSELSDFRMKGGPVTWTENFVRCQSTIKTESTCCALAQSTRSTASSFQHFSHCACCTYLDFLLQGLSSFCFNVLELWAEPPEFGQEQCSASSATPSCARLGRQSKPSRSKATHLIKACPSMLRTKATAWYHDLHFPD